MHLLKQFEQVATVDPYNPTQHQVHQRVGIPGGWATFYFNEVPVTPTLQGLRGGLGLSWVGLPAWLQIAIVGGGSAVAGYFAMKKWGASTIKPALSKVGINLSGLGGNRTRRHKRKKGSAFPGGKRAFNLRWRS
jgi:hypothetical protein